MRHYQSPNKYISKPNDITFFLGGSIEMDKAEKWQDALVEYFNNEKYKHLVFLNPRQADWDASCVQDPTPGSQFHTQVTWEMDLQDIADHCIYYFANDTISPITLLELGTYALSGSTIVRVTPDYFRYGNVKIFCNKHNIKHVTTLDDVIAHIEHIYNQVAN